MKRLKIFVVLLLAAVIPLGGLAACGGRKHDDSTLTIAFAECGYGREWLVQMLDAFKESVKDDIPDFKYELEGDAGITAKLSSRLDTHTELADIMMGLQTNWQMWALKGQLEDITDVYASQIDNGKTLMEKMQPGLRDYGNVNGKHYVIPWNDGATGIVYNLKMFREHNWSVPETVDELLDLCEQIKEDTDGEVSPFTWGGQVGSYWNFPVVAWWAQVEGVQGMRTFNSYADASVFAQEGRLLALQAFEDLIVKDKTNSVSGVMSKNHISSQMDFVNGRAAMIPNGSWIRNEMKGSAPAGFEYAMMPTPFVSEEYSVRTNFTAAGDFIMIPKEAQNKDLAKRFLKFMATDEMIQLYFDVAVGILPYQYTYDVTGADDFMKSIVEINANSENIYMYGRNAMYYRNLVNMWPVSGSPYGMIFDGMSAEELFEMERDQSAQKWALWKQQAGM